MKPWFNVCRCGRTAVVCYAGYYRCGECAIQDWGTAPALEWELIEKASH